MGYAVTLVVIGLCFHLGFYLGVHARFGVGGVVM